MEVLFVFPQIEAAFMTLQGVFQHIDFPRINIYADHISHMENNLQSYDFVLIRGSHTYKSKKILFTCNLIFMNPCADTFAENWQRKVSILSTFTLNVVVLNL